LDLNPVSPQASIFLKNNIFCKNIVLGMEVNKTLTAIVRVFISADGVE
jgi:hypothetical protein